MRTSCPTAMAYLAYLVRKSADKRTQESEFRIQEGLNLAARLRPEASARQAGWTGQEFWPREITKEKHG